MDQHPYHTAIGTVPDHFNMASYVLGKANETPTKIALKVIDAASADAWTFHDIATAVRTTATGLAAHGVQTGDHVLMRLGNTPDFPVVYLATILLGAVPIPTSTQLTTPEITAIAHETQPVLVVADEGISRPDGPWKTLEQSALAGFSSLAPAEPHMGDPNRPAYIIYTSGTSGKPRPVVHAHRAIWARRMMWDGWYGLESEDVVLHAGAFNWTYTLGTGLMDPWAIGATALIPKDGTPAGDVPALLAKHNATIFAAAPGVYRRLLRSDIPKLPSLRHGLSAGEKLPNTTAKAWQTATGTPIFEAYGMSECSTFISAHPGAQTDALGWPQKGRSIALLQDGNPVAEGQNGTIAVHKDDPGLMLGYYNAKTETAARFDGDWFLTGDIGRKGPDGAIHYAGRDDDMMNAGGYRVSPIEVENALAAHPDIDDIAACEIRVSADTSIITAFYVSVDVIDDAQLAGFAAKHLARYKVPRQFIQIDALPRGANNKILRRQLRQNWETAHGQA
ncbi:acyl--CoA ligase [Rhodobacteraceae bacterium S2214]|nr:acyl--CoA ligase [Rhodobacteraceae bacterium S2214]